MGPELGAGSTTQFNKNDNLLSVQSLGFFIMGAAFFASTPALKAAPFFPPRLDGAGGCGILLVGEGGDYGWVEAADVIRRSAGAAYPVEVAAGPGDQAGLRLALERLENRHVSRAALLPLYLFPSSPFLNQTLDAVGLGAVKTTTPPTFVSRTGTVIPRLPVRSDPPVVSSSVRLLRTAPLGESPFFPRLIASRARAVSKSPRHTVLFLVGNVSIMETSSAKAWETWAQNVALQAGISGGFKRARAFSLREDGPDAERVKHEQVLTAAALKELYSGHLAVVPLEPRPGLAESGARNALRGLLVDFASKPLLPDPILGQWALAAAEKACGEAR